jgi:hypothetical protein
MNPARVLAGLIVYQVRYHEICRLLWGLACCMKVYRVLRFVAASAAENLSLRLRSATCTASGGSTCWARS